MDRKELIDKYLEFFESKNHKTIPSSSLMPINDPTVLFITAGMHPLVPYLLGQAHPLGKRLVSCQKCIRTADIDDVGDEKHLTFFEMLGNWSLGDYWKKESIEWSYEFLTKILNIPSIKIEVTCFSGDKDAKKDEESTKIWQSLGIKKNKIKFLGKADNWWGPAGKTGPCGPDTEIFVNGFEIWNNVFMQYNQNEKGKYKELSQRNVDTGMGVERTITIINKIKDVYKTDSFLPIIKEIEKLSKKAYGKDKDLTRAMRVIADHIKASVFILSENIKPSNVEQGYVLRRLIRRAIRYAKFIDINVSLSELIPPVLSIYSSTYPELIKNQRFIINGLIIEEEKFKSTLEKGLKMFKKLANNKTISGKEAFLLYQSYGFPIEMIKEESRKYRINFKEEEFKKELEKHQTLSQTASAGKFKSGLADFSEKTTKLHTATHLLNEALRQVLGDEIKQKGSNITSERLRFDFAFNRKLTEKEKKQVELLVNEKIQENLSVINEEMPLEKAILSGAQAEFGNKYPEIVSVYTIEDPTNKKGWFSKEICTGPHVSNTGELAENSKTFKIVKEESSSFGVRRIKAVLE